MIQLGSGNWISDNCHVPGFNIPDDYRPEWKPGVVRGFRTAHFNNANFPLDGTNQVLRNRGEKEISLNHVLSWAAIKEIMSDLLEDIYQTNGIFTNTQSTARKRLLRDFIIRIFTPDAEAYVRTESSRHAFNRRSEGHVAYLGANGADLITRNNEIRTNALNTLNDIDIPMIGINNANCRRIKMLLNDVYNAPANLRYGMHDRLGELIDPMGDDDGRLTTKESHWISYNNYDWQKSTINHLWYLESSTGRRLRERGVYVPSYWIECPATNPNCIRI